MINKFKEILKPAGCFGIDISIQNDYPLIEAGKTSILRLNPGSKFSCGNPVIIDADPFLFVHNNTLFLFYEDLHFFGKGGVIKMMSTSDLKNWTKPITVIKEPGVHFSFPYVFEDAGNVYIIPETGKDGTIRLYEAKGNGLTSFERKQNIFERKGTDNYPIDLADNIVLKKDGVYYLFTSKQDKDGYILELYTSTNLTGPYTIHPAAPVQHSNKYGRNGGAIIAKGDKMYRVAQDCSETYGGDIHLMEIDELTPNSYKEHVFKENIIPKHIDYYKRGGHQLHFVNYKGKIIVATDAKQDKPFYFVRIVNKTLTKLHLRKRYV